MGEHERTGVFRLGPPPVRDPQEIFRYTYQALAEKGYSPVDQIVGYLLSPGTRRTSRAIRMRAR